MNLQVTGRPGATTGELKQGDIVYQVSLGRSGIVAASDKREGDGATPAGTYPLRCIYYRPDREELPATALPAVALHPGIGWCDDSADNAYNQAVTLPYAASHEELWREDHAYDYIVVIGYNDAPTAPGLGSAIFMHIMHDDGRPTAGCVALSADAMRAVLAGLAADSTITIQLA